MFSRCFFVLYILVIGSTGCGNNFSIGNFHSETWKNDKWGCNGTRAEMTNELNDVLKQLIGMKKNTFLGLFGKPETTELHPKGQLLYRYHITPSKFCDTHQTSKGTQILEIRINALGIVSEAYISHFLGPSQ
jgi:hypothetical protein